jgi:CRP-like cAMP-binding protein
MYYISYGLVDIFSKYGTEHQELITTLTTHQFFGEMGLIEKLPRSATAVSTDNDTNLRIITIEEMDKLFEENQSMVLMILKHLSGRLRGLTNDYINACKVVAEMSEAEEERRKLGAEYMKSMDYYIAEASRYTNTFVH